MLDGLEGRLERFWQSPAGVAAARLRRWPAAWIVSLLLIILLPLLNTGFGFVAGDAELTVQLALLGAWFALAAFLATEGRTWKASAAHAGEPGQLLQNARTILADAGFTVTASPEGSIEAQRGWRARHVLWGEPEWKEFPLRMTVSVRVAQGQVRVEVQGLFRLLRPIGRMGETFRALLRQTVDAVAALDPAALRACNSTSIHAVSMGLRFGGLALRIHLTLFAMCLLSMGAIMFYGQAWLDGEETVLAARELQSRLGVVRLAAFGPVDRAVGEEADRLMASMSTTPGFWKRNLAAVAKTLPATAGSRPLFAANVTEDGTVRFLPASAGGARVPLGASDHIEYQGKFESPRETVTLGFRGGLFRGALLTGSSPGSGIFGARGILLGAFLTFSDLERSALPFKVAMDFVVWQSGRPVASLAWRKGVVRATRGDASLPDEVAAAALERRMRAGDTSGVGLGAFLRQFVLTPSARGLPGIIREEGSDWLALYDFHDVSPGAGFGGYSLALPREAVGISKEDLFTYTIAMLMLAMLVLGAVSILGAVLSSYISLPILQIKDALKAIADGNFSFRMETRRRDELGQLTASVNKLASELQRREAIKELLGKYMSRQVAEKILKEDDPQSLAGTQREMSVLFADVRGFTSYSERHPAAAVVQDLNEYFSVMVDIIAGHEGVLDKYIGDGLMVVFGAPHDQPDHARRAVITALEMQAALQSLNLKRAQRGEDPIAIGIGVNTGIAISGRLGSVKRMEFTVIGDTVNLASRLEHQAQRGQILVGPGTFERVREMIDYESLGQVQVKGKKEAVGIWLVKGLKPATP